MDRPTITRNRRLRVHLFERDQGLCVDCGRFHPKWEGEHTVPLWCGGKDDLSNLVTRCPPCHKRKTAKEAGQRAKSDRLRERHELTQRRMAVR